jgi:hypothetical protein
MVSGIKKGQVMEMNWPVLKIPLYTSGTYEK